MQGSHHAGLLPAWKNLVEKLFQKGLIKVVFATETLAAGINMPARSTVISSTSKRTDGGHRMLTANEFLQMSGRAGRRGMDVVGDVTIVGSQYQSPEEVAELVLSPANPLESRFSPTYSMVLNLLQRFSLDEAKELILKSFGYYSSAPRLKPLLKQAEIYNAELKEREFLCPYKLPVEDFFEYNQIRRIYVQNRQTYKKILKQERAKNRPLSQEVIDFNKENKAMLARMHDIYCDMCKYYKKHAKSLEVVGRIKQKQQKLKEIIYSHILENLTPAQLAAVICAITTEDLRIDMPYMPVSEPVRKTLNLIKNIRRRVEKVQGRYQVEAPMYINAYFSSMIELWVEGAEWETVIENIDMGEGDVVRSFKRVVDVLRQFTTISNVPEALVFTAREAIGKIQREPVNVD